MPATPSANPLPRVPVYEALETRTYTGAAGDYTDTGTHGALSLADGTLSLSFSVADLPGKMAIISKDGSGRADGGQFTVWARDGLLKVSIESATETKWLQVPDLVLTAGKTYHLGVTFGADGLTIWLDGEIAAAAPQWTGGIDGNDRALVIGGSRAWRDTDARSAHSLFDGEIGNVMIFDRQLAGADMRALAAAVDPALDDAAATAAALEDLMPLFGDAHHGSETLQGILADHGVDMHGHPVTMPALRAGTAAGETLGGTQGADGLDGGMGDDVVAGYGGDDILQGGYGNDTLGGGDGNDILDGGHGEDRLFAGAGNDLLISRADGREPEIHPDPGRAQGDPLGELTNGKLYPDQPIPADDVLQGGAGGDIFYFQTLINAKERYIEKHTNSDGSINWHRVAGENDKLHDHWVDWIGNDVVLDYDRADGDRIVIEGHTTRIASISYGDADGNGVMDHSVIALYSDQGSGGGAHNDDRLGTITVYGDLVKRSDIEHSSAPAYGIIHTIDDLPEALAPADAGTDTGPVAPPPDLPSVDDLNVGGLPEPVFGVPGSQAFMTEQDAPLVFAHRTALEMQQGTIAFNFVADRLVEHQVLFSKDASGKGNGGHVTAYVDELGNLTVRVQDQEKSYYMTADLAVRAGQSYDFALTFGADGVKLFMDGILEVYNPYVDFDLTGNSEYLVVGASGWSNTPGMADRIHSGFNGTISDFVVLDRPLTGQEFIEAGFGTGDVGQLGRSVLSVDLTGTDADDVLAGDVKADTLSGGNGNDDLRGLEGDDVLRGGAGHDTLQGGDGNDTINGGDGDDQITGGDTENNGRDQIFAGAGDDVVDAGYGNDLVYGMDGNDTIAGGVGVDELMGQGGDDVISGSAFSDLLFGGAGNDFLNGGFGHDRINGGAGADKFYHQGTPDHGSDWVQDYASSEGDLLVFGDAAATIDDFRITLAHTANQAGDRAGADDQMEAFVSYAPTGQIVWALVDGAGEASINLRIGAEVFDLLA